VRPSTLRRRIPLLVAVVFGVVLVIVVRNLVADSGGKGGRPTAADRRDCIPLSGPGCSW
jgi:hypothetical protein